MKVFVFTTTASHGLSVPAAYDAEFPTKAQETLAIYLLHQYDRLAAQGVNVLHDVTDTDTPFLQLFEASGTIQTLIEDAGSVAIEAGLISLILGPQLSSWMAGDFRTQHGNGIADALASWQNFNSLKGHITDKNPFLEFDIYNAVFNGLNDFWTEIEEGEPLKAIIGEGLQQGFDLSGMSLQAGESTELEAFVDSNLVELENFAISCNNYASDDTGGVPAPVEPTLPPAPKTGSIWKQVIGMLIRYAIKRFIKWMLQKVISGGDPNQTEGIVEELRKIREEGTIKDIVFEIDSGLGQFMRIYPGGSSIVTGRKL